MDEIDDIAVVSEDISAADAFDHVRTSKRSVILIQGSGGAKLFSAESVHAAAVQSPGASVREALGRTGAPDLLAPQVKLLGVAGARAHVQVATKSMFDVMSFSVGIHTCEGNPTHSYYDWQLKLLAVDGDGDYICDFDPTKVT